jgi:hypothetical protein
MSLFRACFPRSDKRARFSNVTAVGVSTDEEDAESCTAPECEPPAPSLPPRTRAKGTRILLLATAFVRDCRAPVRELDLDVANEEDDDALKSIQKTVEHWNFIFQNFGSIRE